MRVQTESRALGAKRLARASQRKRHPDCVQQQRRALAQRARAVQIIGRGPPLVGGDKATKDAAHEAVTRQRLQRYPGEAQPEYLIMLRATTTAAGGQRQQVQLTRRRASEDGRWRTSGKPQMAARRHFTARSSCEPLCPSCRLCHGSKQGHGAIY